MFNHKVDPGNMSLTSKQSCNDNAQVFKCLPSHQEHQHSRDRQE